MTVRGLVAFLYAVPDATYRGIADADPDAVGDLVTRSAECRACHRHLDAIADVAAELLTTISTDTGRTRLKEAANPRAYFAVALTRRARMADSPSRSIACSLDEMEDEPIDIAALDPARRLQDWEELDLIRKGIQRLPAGEQSVVLGLEAGMSYEQLAGEMHRRSNRPHSVHATRDAAFRARAKLASVLTASHDVHYCASFAQPTSCRKKSEKIIQIVPDESRRKHS